MSLKKKIVDSLSLYLCRYKNVQNFFAVKNSEINTDGISPERSFFDIDNLEDFNRLCGEYNFTVPDADAKERFDSGDHFCMTAENGIYGCWGWVATEHKDFYVLEIDSHSVIPENAAVIYHCFTNPEQRRKGFYYDFLRLVAKNNGKEYSIIYAYDTNTASKNAIKKASYRDFGEMSRKTFCGFDEIIRRYAE